MKKTNPLATSMKDQQYRTLGPIRAFDRPGPSRTVAHGGMCVPRSCGLSAGRSEESQAAVDPLVVIWPAAVSVAAAVVAIALVLPGWDTVGDTLVTCFESAHVGAPMTVGTLARTFRTGFRRVPAAVAGCWRSCCYWSLFPGGIVGGGGTDYDAPQRLVACALMRFPGEVPDRLVPMLRGKLDPERRADPQQSRPDRSPAAPRNRKIAGRSAAPHRSPDRGNADLRSMMSFLEPSQRDRWA